MTKREDINQLRHDYFMLSQRVELLEHRMREILTNDHPEDTFKQLNGKTLEDVQKAWHARNKTVLQDHGQQPKINDLSKGHWIPTPSEAAPKPYAHPRCED